MSRTRILCAALVAMVCVLFLNARSAPAGVPLGIPELAAVLKAHRLRLLSMHVRPPNLPDSDARRTRHAGGAAICVVSQDGPRSVQQVQEATEQIRMAVEALGTRNLFAVGVQFYVPSRASQSRGMGVPVADEPLVEGANTVNTIGIAFNGAGSDEEWYARSICFRPFETSRGVSQELVSVRAWRRLDWWCGSNTEAPREGVKVVVRPQPAKSQVEPKPSLAAVAGPARSPGTYLVAMSIATQPMAGAFLATQVRLEHVTEGRPLDPGEFAVHAKRAFEHVESLPVDRLGSVVCVVSVPWRLDVAGLAAMRPVSRRSPAPGDRSGTLLFPGTESGPKEGEPVSWYGLSVVQRTIELQQAGGVLLFLRTGPWQRLVWWSAANVMQQPAGEDLRMHAAKPLK